MRKLIFKKYIPVFIICKQSVRSVQKKLKAYKVIKYLIERKP